MLCPFDFDTLSQRRAYYELVFDAPLTNAGGEVGLVAGFTDVPGASRFILCDALEGCAGGLSTISGGLTPAFNASNILVGTVIPLPAGFWLFGSALLVLLRKRSRRLV